MLAIKAMVVASHKVLLLQVLARRDLTTPHAGHGPSDQYLPFRMFVVWACETSNLRPISRCVSPLPFSARLSFTCAGVSFDTTPRRRFSARVTAYMCAGLQQARLRHRWSMTNSGSTRP